MRLLLLLCILSLVGCQDMVETTHIDHSTADIYDLEIKFIGLRGNSRQKIQNTILDLEAHKPPYLKIDKGGQSYGDEVSYRILWLHRNHSQEKIIEIIKEFAETNQLPLSTKFYAPGNIIFQPR